MQQSDQTDQAMNQASELPVGSMLLQGQYEIKDHLAVGGFGKTYLARDSVARLVVVKECFSEELCYRHGKLVLARSDNMQDAYQNIVWNFVWEARRLAKLKHPNIVAVHQVFEENHTAYMAMDYVDGVELLEILETTPGRMTPALIEQALSDALEALKYLHGKGILHRDVSPDNILLDTNNHLTLIDFGAACDIEQTPESQMSSMLAVKDGYSPHEFYEANTTQSAASDLYSLGATFYHLIAGEAPPDGWTRHLALESGGADPYRPLAGGRWDHEENFLLLIDRALSVPLADRVQSAADWLDNLSRQEPEPETRQDRGAAAVAKGQVIASPSDVMPSAELDLAIAKLVSSTRSGAESAPEPAKRRDKAAPAPAVAAKPAPARAPVVAAKRQPVDIFGNPIENVESWMEEQERAAAHCGTRTETTGEHPDDATDNRRKTLLGRLLFGKRAGRRDDTSMARS